MKKKYSISFHKEKTKKVEVWQFLETPRAVFRQENDWDLSTFGLKEYGRNNKAGCEGDYPTAFISISPCQQQSFPFKTTLTVTTTFHLHMKWLLGSNLSLCPQNMALWTWWSWGHHLSISKYLVLTVLLSLFLLSMLFDLFHCYQQKMINLSHHMKI